MEQLSGRRRNFTNSYELLRYVKSFKYKMQLFVRLYFFIQWALSCCFEEIGNI